MKTQTFGVEIEMYGISREKAAKLAAEFFGTGNYEYTAYKNGYRSHSAYDSQDREWKFSRDSSIIAPDDEKCEMVTPILTYEDIETLQELCRQLRHAGAKSDPGKMCGIHIHVGGDGHTPQSLRNLTNIMASHEELIADALKIDENRKEHYCRVVDKRFLKTINQKKPKTNEELEDIWYKSQNANYGRREHYNDSRYHMLNLHSYFHGHGTIEFRLFQFDRPTADRRGGIHAGQLKSYIQFCLALSNMAKTVKKASPKPQQNENPKYAMRTWLLRLGFIGDEFKTARNVLTKNLSGNAAFR